MSTLAYLPPHLLSAEERAGDGAAQQESWKPVGGLIDQILARMTVIPDPIEVSAEDEPVRKLKPEPEVTSGEQYEFGWGQLPQAA
ncbi:MAG: hypothetical protein AAFQ45_06685 [Pseudomonadota bacterium]